MIFVKLKSGQILNLANVLSIDSYTNQSTNEFRILIVSMTNSAYAIEYSTLLAQAIDFELIQKAIKMGTSII